MNGPLMSRRILDRREVGASYSFRRTFTDADSSAFIGVTWDINPYHTDDTFSAQTRMGKRCLPGLLTASMFTHLGGLCGFLAQRMDFQFLAPVYAGDTVEARVVVSDVSDRGKVTLDCVATTADGREVLRGTVWGYPSEFAPS